MKNLCKVLILACVFMCVNGFTFTAFAENSQVESDLLYSDMASDIVENIDPEVKNVLESLGLDEYSAQEISNIGISDVFNSIIGVFKGSLKKPFSCLCMLIGIIILTSVTGCFLRDDSAFGGYYESVSVLFVGLSAFSAISDCIHSAVSSAYGIGIFLKSLIPIMAGITASSGNPALAVSYNAVALYSAEIITAVCGDFLTPVMCIFSAVSVCSGVNTVVDTNAFTGGFKKFVNIILGLCGTVFTGVLAIKDILCVNIDKVSVKGIKFILGSSVPVIGGNISDCLSSVLASVSLLKSTYGILGIIIIAVISVPSLCEILLWMFALSLASYAASSMDQQKTAGMLSSLHFVVSVLFSIVIFISYISIISTAMVVLLGGRQ